MKAPTIRIEDGTFITHTWGPGFRARCACGWTGEDRGFNVVAANDDADEHEAKRCGL